jgi:hypothetical protein
MECAVDMHQLDNYLRKGFVRVQGSGFRPNMHGTYLPDIECVWTEVAINQDCDIDVTKIEDVKLHTDLTDACKKKYNT